MKAGLVTEEPLTWDLLLSLALIDGLAGDGGELWGRYCQAILPAPEALTMPMCWSVPRLDNLQHADIKEAALKQQVGRGGGAGQSAWSRVFVQGIFALWSR